MTDTKTETPTAPPVVATPNKDRVERIVASKGWDLRELKTVPLFRERVVLNLGKKFNQRAGKTGFDYIRVDGSTFEECYGKIIDALSARGIEIL